VSDEFVVRSGASKPGQSHPFTIIVALAWWIQHRRDNPRDEDFYKAQERQLERLAQENIAAYRNGFDNGQTTRL